MSDVYDGLDLSLRLAEWDDTAALGIEPPHVSDGRASVEDREAFLRGAFLLGLEGGVRKRTVKPQQLRMVDAVASSATSAAVLMPRRSSKTTSLQAFAVGRAATREEYRVGILSMTTGKAGRSRFLKDVAPSLDRIRTKHGEDAPFRTWKSAGLERVEFKEHGSSVAWLSSIDDMRGEYFDMLIFDEAGEPEPDKVTDAKDAGFPTLDTAENGLLVVAGTAGRYRDGNLLWDYLERLRDGSSGGIAYAFPDEIELDEVNRTDPGNWDRVSDLLAAHHPGVGTLTTLDRLHESWRGIDSGSFLREYGGHFGSGGSKSKAFSPTRWNELALKGELPSPPARFAIAVSTHVDQRAASIVAAWRVDGKAHLLLLAHGIGTAWLVPKLIELHTKYKTKIWHDSSGPTRAETLDRRLSDARVKLEPVKANQVTAAAALLVREVDSGQLVHYGQPELTESALSAVKRQRYSGWSLASDEGFDGDVTAIEAASFALLAYDGMPPEQKKFKPS